MYQYLESELSIHQYLQSDIRQKNVSVTVVRRIYHSRLCLKCLHLLSGECISTCSQKHAPVHQYLQSKNISWYIMSQKCVSICCLVNASIHVVWGALQCLSSYECISTYYQPLFWVLKCWPYKLMHTCCLKGTSVPTAQRMHQYLLHEEYTSTQCPKSAPVPFA